MKRQGIYFAGPGDLITIVFYTRGEDGHLRCESLYSPTMEELEHSMRRYGLPFEETLARLNERAPDTHTIIIDVEKYLDSL